MVDNIDNKKQYGMYAMMKIDVTDENGNIVQTIERKSESFTKNFLGILLVGFNINSTGVTLVNTAGGGINASPGTDMFSIKATTGATGFGIVIGTDSTDVDVNQFNLIAPNTTFTHNAQTVNSVTAAPNGLSSSFTLVRGFANATGGSITIKECAIYSKLNGATNIFMILRDRTNGTTGVPVSNGQTMTVTYTITAAV